MSSFDKIYGQYLYISVRDTGNRTVAKCIIKGSGIKWHWFDVEQIISLFEPCFIKCSRDTPGVLCQINKSIISYRTLLPFILNTIDMLEKGVGRLRKYRVLSKGHYILYPHSWLVGISQGSTLEIKCYERAIW